MTDRTAELYVNKRYPAPGAQARRWWATDEKTILVGGSIFDAADVQHLRNSFGVTAVLSVESEHSDTPMTLPLLHMPVGDDGTPKPAEFWAAAVTFAKGVFSSPNQRLYVHCQMGGSRSPAVTYAILRSVFGLTPEKALEELRVTVPSYGHHEFHQRYLKSFEDARLLFRALL